MKKSRREWLMEAKEQGCEWADDAIENAENSDFGGTFDVLEVSLSEALLGAFSWSQSPQGLAYWRVIHNHLVSEEKTMSDHAHILKAFST